MDIEMTKHFFLLSWGNTDARSVGGGVRKTIQLHSIHFCFIYFIDNIKFDFYRGQILAEGKFRLFAFNHQSSIDTFFILQQRIFDSHYGVALQYKPLQVFNIYSMSQALLAFQILLFDCYCTACHCYSLFICRKINIDFQALFFPHVQAQYFPYLWSVVL